MDLRFSWDDRKDQLNQKKHNVAFKDATECFYDERALIIKDILHSTNEERFVLIGEGLTHRILVVIHSYKEEIDLIRIISARLATRTEMNAYYRGSL